MTMAGKEVPNMTGLRVFPPPPKGFDPLTATKTALARHGLPQRPDPQTQPELAAFWEERARRYRDFEHLEPRFLPVDQPKEPPTDAVAEGLTLSEFESCGYELIDASAPITMFTGTWTIPNLKYTPNAGQPDHIRTFFGLGFLDLHVEMTIDASQNITTVVRIHTGDLLDISVRPGDAISATLCLQDNAAGTAFYGVVNETTAQVVNFTVDTHFPRAVKINAGVSRGSQLSGLPDALARFGVVYFDELQGFSTGGKRLLTNGQRTNMKDLNGTTLAIAQKLNDSAFKVVFAGS
jgi:hypothetical protein